MDTTLNATTDQPTVIRTGRGLTIAGTRITLYQVVDYLKDNWPPHLIQHWLDITEQQMADVLAYIDSHRDEVEAEYQLVLREAEEDRQYWEERNRERMAEIARLPPKPGQEEIRAKLQEARKRLGWIRDDSGRPQHRGTGGRSDGSESIARDRREVGPEAISKNFRDKEQEQW
jgi:uncharacterized protein (DUF433 family)